MDIQETVALRCGNCGRLVDRNGAFYVFRRWGDIYDTPCCNRVCALTLRTEDARKHREIAEEIEKTPIELVR